MEHKERNLLSLKAEFHDKGKAMRGFNTIMNFIDSNKKAELEHLLRFHDPISVHGQELTERFEIDSLIEYYNLLIVAIFSGYVPGELDEISRDEIIATLGHPSVIPYYQEHYIYKMASYTLQYAKENRRYEREGDAISISAFNEFISLNRILKRDKDIELFLGMLDHVWYGNNTITGVIKILASDKKLNEAFTAKNKTKAQIGVIGFIKYTTFLSQLKELLLTIEEYPLLQSSFWMFHGYYLDRMNVKMKNIFENAFENLEKSLSDPTIFYNIVEEVYGGEVPEELRGLQLREFAETAVNQSRDDVNFVLNQKWGDSLKEYFM